VPIRAVAVLAGAAVWAVAGGLVGLVAGVLVATLLDRGLRRLEPRERRLDREAASAALPFAADLVAAALLGGATVHGALGCVATAIGGALGRRLGEVAAACALDVEPAEAWQPLADVAGSAPIMRAAIRSGQSGAALAVALRRAADAARSAAEAAEEDAGRRAAVLVVLPVGLCFLPAFVLLGVVPVVVGVLAQVLPR
jgi:pilus assembly protein TadC